MNKRFSQFLLAGLMAFAMLVPMFSQSVQAQVRQGGANVRTDYLISQMNQRALAFQNIFNNGMQTLGQERLIVLLAADFGVPTSYIRATINNSGTALDQLALALFLADASSVPLSSVLSLFSTGSTFGDLAIQFNANTHMITISLGGFQSIILQEVNSNGNVSTTNNLMGDRITRAIALMQTRFSTLDTILGHALFNDLLLRTLSNETGRTVDDLMNQLRSGNLNLNSMVLSVILENILTAVSDFTVDRRLVVGDQVVIDSFNRAGLPASIFINRINGFFQVINNNAKTTTTRGGGKVGITDGTGSAG